MRPLSYQQRLFVEYYLGESEGSAADAARRAGYRWPEKLGPRLVQISGIEATIDARVATAAIAANEVLARIADVATSDLLNFIEVDNNGGWKVDLKLVKRLGLGHLIKRLRKNKDGTSEQHGRQGLLDRGNHPLVVAHAAGLALHHHRAVADGAERVRPREQPPE